MFGTEEKKELIKPSQIIESVYPGMYDEHFLEKADEIKIIIEKGLTMNICKIHKGGWYEWKEEGKPTADALIAEVRKRSRLHTFIPF